MQRPDRSKTATTPLSPDMIVSRTGITLVEGCIPVGEGDEAGSSGSHCEEDAVARREEAHVILLGATWVA